MAKGLFQRLRSFFLEGIWNIPLDPAKPIRSFFIEASRVLVASIRGFSVDECFLKASSLTFYSLLSIVPVLAVAFGIGKGFGFQHKLEEEILYQFKEQPEIAKHVIKFAYSFLDQTQGSVIAGVGAIVLFWTVFKLLSTIESTLNDIWKVPAARSWTRKLTDYMTMTLLCPFFFAASSSLTILITRELIKATKSVGYFDQLSPVITFIFYSLPYLFAWILFGLVYLIMPNTRVSWKAASVAGIVAGTAYQLLQLLFIQFQIGVSNYGAIYGSFAALPLFLLWLNTSWLIVLGGAEIAYHSEYDYQGISGTTEKSNTRQLVSEKVLGILICKLALSQLKEGLPPLTLRAISVAAGVNLRTIKEVAENLYSCGLLTRATNDQGEELILPAKKMSEITIKAILDAFDQLQGKHYFVHPSEPIESALQLMQSYQDDAGKLSANVIL